MRASMHLGRLNDAAQYRLRRLQDLYNTIDAQPKQQQTIRLAYIAVELDNLNICVLREFTISTIRKAKTSTGRRINVNKNLGPAEEIGAYILSVVNPVRFRNIVKHQKLKDPIRIKRTDEQAVRDPKEIEKVLIDCTASNLSSLQKALSLNSSLFRDLKFIRHFYAHRNKDTFIKASSTAANMGILNFHHPDQILKHVIVGRSHSILEEWLMDAQLFYELLMQ